MGAVRQLMQRDGIASIRRAGRAPSGTPAVVIGPECFDELGDGFTLLDLGSPNAFVQEFRRAADALGIPLKVIEDSRPTVGSFTKRRLFWCAPINLSPGRRIARPAIRPKS